MRKSNMRALRRNFSGRGMTPVRQVTIGPMFVGRKLEEIGWESVPMNDPRINAHPDWLENLQKLDSKDGRSVEINQTVRFKRNGDSWQGVAVPSHDLPGVSAIPVVGFDSHPSHAG